MTYQKNLQIKTFGRNFTEITEQVQKIVNSSHIKIGLCNIFIPHTSASIILCENTDPEVRNDLESFTKKWVLDGDSLYNHTLEGPDDMPAHIRTVFTQSSLTIPLKNGQILLGTWQGIYLWEHRTSPHNRTIIVTVS